MELDCSKLMLGGSRRDGWGTIGGLDPLAPPPLATRLHHLEFRQNGQIKHEVNNWTC